MTDTSISFRTQWGIARRLWNWLTAHSHRAPAAHLDTLSDRMLRDIGVEREELDRMATRTLHDAMRYSG